MYSPLQKILASGLKFGSDLSKACTELLHHIKPTSFVPYMVLWLGCSILRISQLEPGSRDGLLAEHASLLYICRPTTEHMTRPVHRPISCSTSGEAW